MSPTGYCWFGLRGTELLPSKAFKSEEELVNERLTVPVKPPRLVRVMSPDP